MEGLYLLSVDFKYYMYSILNYVTVGYLSGFRNFISSKSRFLGIYNPENLFITKLLLFQDFLNTCSKQRVG